MCGQEERSKCGGRWGPSWAAGSVPADMTPCRDGKGPEGNEQRASLQAAEAGRTPNHEGQFGSKGTLGSCGALEKENLVPEKENYSRPNAS